VAGAEAAEGLARVGPLAREAKPEHVHRRAEGHGLEPRPAAHERVATVGGGQSGRDPPEAVGGAVANAGYAAGLLKNVDHLGAHAQVEVRQLPRRIGQKVEEIPLGDEGDVGVGNREVLEVGQADHSLVDHRSQLRDTLLGHLREPSAQTKLVEHVERGGMDRVAAEVAEEVIVLFEHEDLDAGAGEEESKHRAGPQPTMQQVVVSFCAI